MRQSKQGSTSKPSSNGKSAVTVADMLQARASKRAAKAQERRAKSEKLKEEGNALYRVEDYTNAIECYQKAIDVHVHGSAATPVLLTNLAAAYIKLEMYGAAHFTATEALIGDPKSVKARFRRGVARQNMDMLDAAVTDFRTVLSLDPENQETKARLGFVEELSLVNEGIDTGYSDDEFPSPSEDPELEDSMSDSSDCEHGGNDIPCKFYNHDGCAKGPACRFSHAPDNKSERDALGKNVCSYFLMGLCKFGDNRCSYSHSREYLPEKGWWTTAEGLTSARKLYKHARVLPKEVVKVAEDYVAASFGRLGKDKAPQKKKSKNGRCQSHAFLYGGSDSEEEELNEYGFTNSDTQELLSQGVKPWDDDAYDVLAALRDGY
ncbi:hypothetical protein PAXINDRAFT_177052 [Paxillus involutus ATCC 200175]|uniref:C3H1-type domain-containing protein n=1 Tax=Paxillus involutus ATCC 200175 TaxID=664439 RepID=A0A0C9SV96_PAXIN|nr:hypothetical protein PAXINDRAFT_177052 [Paxillus involutus ATCC 200175]